MCDLTVVRVWLILVVEINALHISLQASFLGVTNFGTRCVRMPVFDSMQMQENNQKNAETKDILTKII